MITLKHAPQMTCTQMCLPPKQYDLTDLERLVVSTNNTQADLTFEINRMFLLHEEHVPLAHVMELVQNNMIKYDPDAVNRQGVLQPCFDVTCDTTQHGFRRILRTTLHTLRVMKTNCFTA